MGESISKGYVEHKAWSLVDGTLVKVSCFCIIEREHRAPKPPADK